MSAVTSQFATFFPSRCDCALRLMQQKQEKWFPKRRLTERGKMSYDYCGAYLCSGVTFQLTRMSAVISPLLKPMLNRTVIWTGPHLGAT